MSEGNSVIISVSLKREHKKWLNKHPEINVSRLLQKAIDELREKYGD